MEAARMRGAILFMAVLMGAATTQAQAETPSVRSFRPVTSSRVAVPFTPRPPTPASVMPRPVTPRYTPAATPPHCPNPPIKPPISVSIPKPDYNKRTMALIQQNIALMVAMRTNESSRLPCDPSWSAKKLARRGCPPVQIAPESTPGPLSPLAPPIPETISTTAPLILVAEN
jgi:hypothetical protein